MAMRRATEVAATARVSGGYLLSRRAFLKATALAGVALAAAPQPAAWNGGSLLGGGSAAAAETSDPIGALAAALDYDAERIFRFVADEIRYEPYSGILRGARGSLASRAGNSADQALLLAALLRASLLPVRFAIGELDGDTADALLASSVADADAIRQHALDALAATIPGQEPRAGELTVEQQALLDEAVANSDRVVTWARDQLERTVAAIGSALEEAGVELRDGFTPLPDSERSRHVWVQLAQTADWLDLDPTLSDAVPGVAATSAAQTLDALPEEMAHRVEFAIIGETRDGDELTERRLLGYSERAELIAGVPIMVTNVAPQALAALGTSVATVMSGGTSYVPVIIVGEDGAVGSTPITFAAAPDHPATQQDFLAPGGPVSETTAEWIELTVSSPDSEPVIVRREIFDRLGPAGRRANDVTAVDLRPVERSDLADGTESAVLPALGTHWITVSTGSPSLDDPVMRVAAGEDDRAGAIVSQAYHLVRTAAGVDVGTPSGLRTYVDAPNVVAYSMTSRSSTEGEPLVEAILDIWHRSHGAAPVSDTRATLPPMVTTGVLTHIAERLLGGEVGANKDGTALHAHVSVGLIFEAAAAAGIPWRVLQGPGAIDSLAWGDEDARARLLAALSDGWVAIVPESPVVVGGRERVGWWLVDPRTGRTRDQLDDGSGGEAEYTTVIVRLPLTVWTKGWTIFSRCLFFATLAVTGGFVIGVYSGSTDPLTAALGWTGGLGGAGLGTALMGSYQC